MMRRLISALIVFTLVMASVVSVSAAATASVTNAFSDNNVTVTTTIGSAADDEMVSYIIYGMGDEPTSSNIVYIDQLTGNGSFPVVTGTMAELAGKYIRFGSSAGAVTGETIVKDPNNTAKYVSVDKDAVFKAAAGADPASWTFYLTASTAFNNTNNLVGIDVTFSDGTNEYVFEDLTVLGFDGNNTAAIELVNGENIEDDAVFATGDGWTITYAPYYMDDTIKNPMNVKTEGLYTPGA